MRETTGKIRVLIVDDSALVREILSRGLAEDPEIEVVGTAPDVYVARDKIVFLKPDVLTLDVEMPRMDGIDFLKRLMPQYPLPVIMCSALAAPGARATIDALDNGAVDFVLKPSARVGAQLAEMLDELRTKVKMAATVDVSKWRRAEVRPRPQKHSEVLEGSTDKVIAIGASTGGTVALREVISAFPAGMPGTVVVQHMPPVFTRMFAESLDGSCQVDVAEAADGDRVLTGRVLIAPGDRHLEVERSGGVYLVRLKDGPKVNGHRPSVEVLFASVARSVGSNAVGVMLTGMGRDGADAMLSMRQAGARTLAQDEATSVVFGMPRAAYECGGAERLLPIGDMAGAVLDALRKL
jgi:two-component system, chemotaxis family, protein-glutamate methylesterase/glutaminase